MLTDPPRPDESQGAACCRSGAARQRAARLASAHDHLTWVDETVRRDGRGRRPDLRRQARPGHRLPRPQRRRQVHHHAHDPRAWTGPPPGTALIDGQPYAELRRPAARRSARCWTPRPCTRAAAPATTCWPGPQQRHPAPAGSTRCWTPSGWTRGRRQAGRGLLARHGPAARHRRRAARRPAGADVRRAGQRPRPRRRALDPQADALAGRRRAVRSSSPAT